MATYQTIILLNLRKWDNPNKPGTGYSLDVVHSICDGKSKGVGVEFVYFKDGGAKRIGKPLQRKDLEAVWAARPQIKELMDNPPPIPLPPEPEPLTGGTWGDKTGLAGGSLGGGTMEKEDF